MATTPPTLLILAAGMGSRYGGLKQIEPMGPSGETILDYSVYDAIRAGFGKVVFVIREEFENAFRDSVGAKFEDRIVVDYAFQDLRDIPADFDVPGERTKPWGTAHAIRAARNCIEEPFAVINADDFYGRDSYAQAAAFLSGGTEGADCCLVGYYLENTLSDHGGVNRGVTTHQDGHLLNVEEIIDIRRNGENTIAGHTVGGQSRELAAEAIVSMNFWGFTPAFFAKLESEFVRFLETRGEEAKSECYIPTVVDDLISRGDADCAVLATTGTWFGVTYPDDKAVVVESLRRLVASGEYPVALFEE